MTNRLKEIRTAAGLSQAGLSAASGVNLRMIQYYEQGYKDINRAEARNVWALARVLGCHAEDLLQLDEPEAPQEENLPEGC